VTAAELIEIVESAGGIFTITGDRVRCVLPEDQQPLVPELRSNRDEVRRLLAEREQLPVPPENVHILEWHLKPAPVAITTFSVVNDVDKFARHTLEQLGYALAGRNFHAGNRSVRTLVEQLEQVGVKVAVESREAAR
jgi:hypothetical protein